MEFKLESLKGIILSGLGVLVSMETLDVIIKVVGLLASIFGIAYVIIQSRLAMQKNERDKEAHKLLMKSGEYNRNNLDLTDGGS